MRKRKNWELFSFFFFWLFDELIPFYCVEHTYYYYKKKRKYNTYKSKRGWFASYRENSLKHTDTQVKFAFSYQPLSIFHPIYGYKFSIIFAKLNFILFSLDFFILIILLLLLLHIHLLYNKTKNIFHTSSC